MCDVDPYLQRSSSVSSTQPLPTGSVEKPIGGRMKSPLMKLFNSAMGRHSTDDLKSKATPPPSPSYTVMGAGKVGRRESGQDVEPQRLTSVQPSRHSDNQELLESQLTSVLADRSSADGRLSNCAFSCRRVSSTVPPTIDYATLEFGSCTGEGPKSAGFVPTIVAQCGTAGYSDSNATVYAQIDISKSEAIKKCLRH